MFLSKIVYACIGIFMFVSLVFTCNTISVTPTSNDLILQEGVEKCLAKSDNVAVFGQRTFVNDEVFYRNLSIFIEEELVYYNSTTLFSTYYNILPIMRSLPNGQQEILIAFADSPKHLKTLRLLGTKHNVFVQDTLPLFTSTHHDVDRDGTTEFSGYLEPTRPYCIGCDSAYYNPLLTYELRKTGIYFDSLTTRQWIGKHYQHFYGFVPDTTLVVATMQ